MTYIKYNITPWYLELSEGVIVVQRQLSNFLSLELRQVVSLNMWSNCFKFQPKLLRITPLYAYFDVKSSFLCSRLTALNLISIFVLARPLKVKYQKTIITFV
jgi:hypothetical protein